MIIQPSEMQAEVETKVKAYKNATLNFEQKNQYYNKNRNEFKVII